MASTPLAGQEYVSADPETLSSPMTVARSFWLSCSIPRGEEEEASLINKKNLFITMILQSRTSGPRTSSQSDNAKLRQTYTRDASMRKRFTTSQP
ncbi:hypothetical protein VCV18_002671 [Metarhizium anisopliae]